MRTRQQEIIREFDTKPHINPAEEIDRRIAFLQKYLAHTGLNGLVLGISGGQDSLLAGILSQRAVEALRSDGYDAKFHAVLLPYGVQADRSDALLACDTIRPDVVHDIDIKPATDAIAGALTSELGTFDDFHKGNIKARVRMIAQYAIAGQRRLSVVGTDHAAEGVTGFFTKYGDGGADVLPLAGLNKRQGRALLRELGVPELFITKAPTADLLDTKPGQSDEDELALQYDEIDDYLEGKLIDASVAEKIEQRHTATGHKRALPLSYSDKFVSSTTQ